MSTNAEAIKHKDLGNKAFQAKQYEEAVKEFTAAIALDATDAVFHSNRSGAYAGLNRWPEALADAERAVQLRPDWSKAYSRKALALVSLKRLEEAEVAFTAGLKLEPANESMQAGLAQLQDVKLRGMALSSLWATMDWWAAVQSNPDFAALAADSKFRDKLDQIAKDPAQLTAFAGDQDVVRVVQWLVALWVRAFTQQRAEQAADKRDEEAKRARAEQEAKAEQERLKAEEAAREAALPDSHKQAKAAKERGAELYKKKEFAGAVAAFTEALELTPEDISLLTNRAAVHLESGDFAAAVKDGEAAVEVGRRIRADFALVARAFDRIGTGRQRLGELELAVKAFQASLAEQRTAATLTKLSACERELEERKKKAYEDPDKAAAARAEGNRLFKENDFPGAIKQYEEAIKRAPRDPLLYTNLASALGKLLEFPTAIANCKKALEIDPKCFKAHLKKGHFEFFAKDYKNALDSYSAARAIEPDNAEVAQSIERLTRAIQERNMSNEAPNEDAIARDGELQEILSNPAMRSVLNDIQRDPKAFQEHMKNPIMRKNLEKLIAAGVIK